MIVGIIEAFLVYSETIGFSIFTLYAQYYVSMRN